MSCKTIYVMISSFLSEEEKMIVAAHELGHIILHRSHQTSTCGLHLHVNRTAFSANQEGQDEVISRILYFVEHHWNELLKFSRRSEYSMNRWAARYGYEHTPKAIMDKAKKGGNGRYAAVNLCNYHTVEFRLFRGTLKYNTFIDRKSTRLNSSHSGQSRMPSSA